MGLRVMLAVLALDGAGAAGAPAALARPTTSSHNANRLSSAARIPGLVNIGILRIRMRQMNARIVRPRLARCHEASDPIIAVGTGTNCPAWRCAAAASLTAGMGLGQVLGPPDPFPARAGSGSVFGTD